MSICWFADDFAVHEVAKTYEAGCDRHRDGYDVEDGPHTHLEVLAVEQQGQNDAYGTSVAGKALIACEMPVAIYILPYGEQHLDEMVPAGEEIAWLVEEAMSQACSYKDADEAI